MTTPVWPATLPQKFLVRNYAEGGKDNLVRSENEIGPAKVRRRASAAVRPVSGAIIVDDTQLATLRSFIADTIGDGALAFTFPAQSEAGTWLVRFREPIEIVPIGVQWEIAIELEILP